MTPPHITRPDLTRPLIGITIDNVDNDITSGRYESNVAYSQTVARAGGLPVLLPQEVELAGYYVEICDGLMLTGGDDIRPEAFGAKKHPKARCIEPRRQAFELALLDAAAKKPLLPLLGVCMGMQMMSMHAGGKMNQHLPDTLPNAVDEHQNNHRHGVVFLIEGTAMLESRLEKLGAKELVGQTVFSSHHQAVTDAGSLRVVARSTDGVIEAVDDPKRAYYVGVQWHPERGDGLLNFELIKRFVETCAARKGDR